MKRPFIFFIFPVLLFYFFYNLCMIICEEQHVELQSYVDEGIMLVSTINGYIIAIDAKSGEQKWHFKEEPILESPIEIQQGFTFIPNPRDGQLYFIMEGRLSKLPFTIPELVKVSPCRSSDGILYAGNKKDIWISINLKTGQRSEALTTLLSTNFCPISADNVFVGKTEYRVSMYDTQKKNRQWNATFIDYSSHLLPADTHYPYKHYTSTEDGRLMTVDMESGSILWKKEFESVIVNMYWMKKDGLHRLPSMAIGLNTFESLIQNADSLNNVSEEYKQKNLHQTLFVGQSSAGLYALSAFVDSETITIDSKYLGPFLLEGPTNKNDPSKLRFSNLPDNKPLTTSANQLTSKKAVFGDYLLLGYHKTPPVSIVRHLITNDNAANTMLKRFYLQGKNLPQIEYVEDEDDYLNSKIKDRRCIGNQCFTTFVSKKNNEKTSVIIFPHKGETFQNGDLTDADVDDDWTLDFILQQIWRKYPYSFGGTLFLIFVLIIATVWMCGRHSAVVSLMHANSQSGRHDVSQHFKSSNGSSTQSWWSAFSVKDFNCSDTSDFKNGEEKWEIIGKLSYNRKKKLGQGCSGTAVYEGVFDNRKVAVKRVMKEHVELVEREINHLRESDSHANVIRYFCSESDINFQYIALEFCESSLDDYVKKLEVRKLYPQLTQNEILKQASDGIAHLHSLFIVHRDVKPKNILMMLRGGKARVLISDFGLCKAIQKDHNSISRTGIVGTEGWIAPEMVNSSSVTCAVDVFSLGCVFYYVMSGGEHPFGDCFRRQEFILRGEFCLQRLTEESNYIAENLIEDMLNIDAKCRPTAHAVAMHPLFWTNERQLSFLMNVSDRIEKETEFSEPVKRLNDRNACNSIVGKSWFVQLSAPLQNDLRNFRSYRQNSVRELLRAIRNKRHHYRELSDELKESLGNIPDGFVTYFTAKFPKLLMHTYAAMTVCADESVFKNYYPEDLQKFYSQKFDEVDFTVPNYGSSLKVVKRIEQNKVVVTGERGDIGQKFLLQDQTNISQESLANNQSIQQNCRSPLAGKVKGMPADASFTVATNVTAIIEKDFVSSDADFREAYPVDSALSSKNDVIKVIDDVKFAASENLALFNTEKMLIQNNVLKPKAKKNNKTKRKKQTKAPLWTLEEVILHESESINENQPTIEKSDLSKEESEACKNENAGDDEFVDEKVLL